MKLAVLALAAVGSASAWEEQINHPDNIKNLNDLHLGKTDTWVAGENKFFQNKTYEDVKGLLGTTFAGNLLGSPVKEQKYYDALGDVPASFDSRTTWDGLIAPIRDQQQCGSCWAFSAVEVLTDRLRIAKKDKTSPVLSAEDLVACDKSDNGCGGGRLPTAWNFLQNTGVVSDACEPYTSGSGTTGTCQTKCTGSGDYTKYKAASSYAVKGVANMQKEIMTNGPIQVAFSVYKSFMSYKTGVYQKKWYEIIPEGGHAVKIVGWGTESGTDYWLVANSWNTSWGEDGFFKILRGKDHCGIETEGPPYAGMPAV